MHYNIAVFVRTILSIALAWTDSLLVFSCEVSVFKAATAKSDSLGYETTTKNHTVRKINTAPENVKKLYNFTINDKCTMALLESRFDCARDKVLSQKECENRGCCYAPLPDETGPPWCYYPHLYPGYTMGPPSPTKRGQTATLTRASPSYLPKDISTLQMEVIEESAGCLHLTIKDPLSQRYEVQLPGEWSAFQGKADAQDTLYSIDFQEDPFAFTVLRKTNGRVM